VWYLAERKWSAPSLDLLHAALERTGWEAPRLSAATCRKRQRHQIEAVDWKKAQADVKPFLERERGVDLVKK
jgi:hypothetical protein